MNQIKALNESIKSNRIIEEYSNVSLRREYEEALYEKLGGNHSLAIEKLEKLLQHERFGLVMDDEAAKEQSRELRILKYNCYKHLGDMFHLDGDSNKAFDYIFKARDLDDKDVFEMHKWGQIALQQKQLLVAHDFFVKAIKQNPKHWPSMQGILAVLCAEENFFEAYGWALHIFHSYAGDQTAVDVILDIRDKLGPSEYLEKAWSVKFNYSDKKRSSKPSLFPIPQTIETIAETNADFTKFIVNKPTFLLLGRMVKSIYLESINDSKLICERISLDRICPNVINVKSSLQPIHLQRANDVILRKIRKICFEIVEQFSRNGSIIIDDKIPNDLLVGCQRLYLSAINTTNNSLRYQKSFHTESLRYFQHFMIELRTDESFTMLGFMFKWLKYFSMCCRIEFPNELRILFFDIYNYQRNHIDLNEWEHLPYSEILNLFRMSLFYLELKMVLNASKKNYNSECLFDDDMVVLLSHMLFIDGLYLQTDDEQIRLRLKLVHFQYAIQMKEFDLASELLTIIKSELLESLKRIDDNALPLLQPIAPVNQKSKTEGPKKKIKNIPNVDINLNHNVSGNENEMNPIKFTTTVAKAHRKNSFGSKGVSDKSRMIRKPKLRLSSEHLKRRSTVLNNNNNSIHV